MRRVGGELFRGNHFFRLRGKNRQGNGREENEDGQMHLEFIRRECEKSATAASFRLVLFPADGQASRMKSSLQLAFSLLLAATVSLLAQTNDSDDDSGSRAAVNLPYVYLSPDSNHTAYVFADSTSAAPSVHRFPDSTTFGLMEVQNLFASFFNSNNIASGYHVVLAPGEYDFSSPILISNNCVIEGTENGVTVLRYTGPTNQFTVAAVSNIVVNGHPFLGQLSGAMIAVPNLTNVFGTSMSGNVTIRNLTITAATNCTAVMLYDDGFDSLIENVWFGGPGFLNPQNPNVKLAHSSNLEPQDIPYVPGLIGLYVRGQTIERVVNCQFYGLADGLVFDSDAYCSADTIYMQTTGDSTNGFGMTMYPPNSILSLGVGLIAYRAAYGQSLTHIYPYKCNLGVLLKDRWSLSEFADQQSVNKIAAFPDSSLDRINVSAGNDYPIRCVVNSAGGDGMWQASGCNYTITNNSRPFWDNHATVWKFEDKFGPTVHFGFTWSLNNKVIGGYDAKHIPPDPALGDGWYFDALNSDDGGIHSDGKGNLTVQNLASAGGVNAPYTFFDAHTRDKIKGEVLAEVATNQWTGAAQFWNPQTHQLEIYCPGDDTFYDLSGHILATNIAAKPFVKPRFQ